MKFIKSIVIILLAFLNSSCVDKKKEAVNENSIEILVVIEEVSNPAVEAFLNKMINEEHFMGGCYDCS
jgi:PBP1b-binding outer membrane lipoprotein LpoB